MLKRIIDAIPIGSVASFLVGDTKEDEERLTYEITGLTLDQLCELGAVCAKFAKVDGVLPEERELIEAFLLEINFAHGSYDAPLGERAQPSTDS